MKKEALDAIEKEIDAGYITRRWHPEFPLQILNYSNSAQFDNHWTPETMMCRGLILDKGGRVVSRPFGKFFNLDEHLLKIGPLPDEPFDTTDKMDGSLAISYFWNDRFWIASRGSFESDQAGWANEILRTIDTSNWNINFTYLFELLHPDNQIVVDYGELKSLILLAIIETASGVEIHREFWPNSVVHVYSYGMVGRNDIARMEQSCKDNNTLMEGVVIHYLKSDIRVKVKFEEYKRLHYLLTGVSPRAIWANMRDGLNFDYFIDRVPDEFYKWLQETIAQIQSNYDAMESTCKRDFRDLGDRAVTAAYFKTCKYPVILFAMLDNKDYSGIIWKFIKPKASASFRSDHV